MCKLTDDHSLHTYESKLCSEVGDQAITGFTAATNKRKRERDNREDTKWPAN